MYDGKATTVIKKFFDVSSKEYDEVSESNCNDDHVETPSVKSQKVQQCQGQLYINNFDLMHQLRMRSPQLGEIAHKIYKS